MSAFAEMHALGWGGTTWQPERVRRGFLEAIEDGGDVADSRWTLLLMLHGLVQAPAYVDAYRALPVMPEPLGW